MPYRHHGVTNTYLLLAQSVVLTSRAKRSDKIVLHLSLQQNHDHILMKIFCFSVQLHSARAMRGVSGNAVLWGGAEPYKGKLHFIFL